MKRTLTVLTLTPIFLSTHLLPAQAQSQAEPPQAGEEEANQDAGETVASSTASAQEEGSAEAPDVTPPASAEENRKLFQEAEEAYDGAHYDQALGMFELLYARTHHPALLFNMAQAHRMAGPNHCLEAHRLYVQYLVDDPQPPNGSEVRERVKELEPCARAAEERQRAADKEPAAVPQPEAPHPAAKALTIASGAVLIAGLGLFSAGKIRFALAQDECPCEEGEFSTWQTIENVGIGAMVAGGSGLAIGGVWWWASVNPTPKEEAVWLSAGGTF